MLIRLAVPADVQGLRDLRLAWAAETRATSVDHDFDQSFDDWFTQESDRRLFWCAECDGELVGMVNLMVFHRMPYPGTDGFNKTWGYLGNLFVRESHRNRGIGTSLIACCTSHADDNGFARVVLSPSAAAVPLFVNVGFTAADELLVRRPTP